MYFRKTENYFEAYFENMGMHLYFFQDRSGFILWHGSCPNNPDVRKRSLFKGLLQPMGKENKEKQICFKMQKDGEPVWDQTTIDRLWVTTQREAMIESGPPPAETPAAPNPPAKNITEPASKPSPSKAKSK